MINTFVLSFVSQPGNAGDKTWFHCYNPETKQQLLQWKSPSLSCPQKPRQVRSNMKRVLVTYFDWGVGINHQQLVTPGQTINHHY
jgi:hypothetical protein